LQEFRDGVSVIGGQGITCCAGVEAGSTSLPLLIEPLGKFSERNAEGVADVRHIKDVKPTITQFVFAYEPLFPAQLSGQVGLQDAGLFSGLT
jgi:hypothetical protein